MDSERGITEIRLDYPIYPKPRHGHGQAPHQGIDQILRQGTASYRERLESFLHFQPELCLIKRTREEAGNELDPVWSNGFLPALDSVALYGVLAQTQPATYLEIGSGNSTKLARRAIQDQGLRTRIVSIDPSPRAEVDQLCDEVIRQPLEQVNLELFRTLQAGDVLFFDGSHRVFMNSDVVAFFLDVLPGLPPGVQVQIHDIFLPHDYPAAWVDRYYSEQYLLAVALLVNSNKFDVVLPNHLITMDPLLSQVLLPLWSTPELQGIEPGGVSFWFVTK